MAIVAECHFGSMTVKIADDYYRDLSPEENERRRRHAQEVAWGVEIKTTKQIAEKEGEDE